MDEVVSFSKGKQKKRKVFAPPSFLVRLGEMSEESLFASLPGENETASPGSCSETASSPNAVARPPSTVGRDWPPAHVSLG